MAPGLTDNILLSCLLYTTAVSYTLKLAYSSQVASYPFYSIFLRVIPFIAVLQFIYHGFLYPHFVSPLRRFPASQDGRHWLWGHETTIMFDSPRGRTALKWMKELKSESGIIRYWGVFNQDRIIISNPKALADVLNNNCYDFEKPSEPRAFLARILGWGLILAEGDMHKLQRKTMLPSFTVNQIKGLYPIFWDKTNALIDALGKSLKETPASNNAGLQTIPERPEGVVEMSEWSSRVTLDVIGVAAMGREFNSIRDGDNEIAQAYLEILEPTRQKLVFFALNALFPQWIAQRLPLKLIRELNGVVDRQIGLLTRICTDIVRDQKAMKYDEDTEKHNSILASMVRKSDFSDEDLVNQMLTFLAAGHETTASALTWACYLLAKNPDVQKRLRKEIRDNIPSRGHQITAQDLESLPYLNGVCNETIRLYPTVPATIRKAIRNTTISGYPINKNTVVLLVPYAVNRNPEMWLNGDDFVPERWIDIPDMNESEKYEYIKGDPDRVFEGRPNNNGGAASNYAQITFLHGPRQCIAHGFAHAELRTLVAGIVGAFEWELENPSAPVVIAGVVTTKPRDGMWLKMRALDGW